MPALYKEVSERILDQIASGERKVGDQLPPEAIFATELGISRSTLRSAFDELETSGVLLRRKRTGTKIIAGKKQPQVDISVDSTMDMIKFMRESAMCVERVSTVLAVNIELLHKHQNKANYWTEVLSFRAGSDEEKPVCTNCIYIPEYFSDIASELESDTSVMAAIEGKYAVKVGRISSVSTSISCAERDARILGLEVGMPILQSTTEIYEQGGRLMEIVISHFDPDWHQIHINVVIA